MRFLFPLGRSPCLVSSVFAALTLSLSSAALGSAANPPVGFIPKTVQGFHQLPMAVLQIEDGYIYRLPEAEASDFEDLYYINLTDALYDRFSVELLGEVVLMSEGRFAVLHIDPSKVPEVSTILHDERASCGQLIQLTGDEVAVDRAVSPAIPLIPLSTPVEALAGLHAQVSPDSIEALVARMSSLNTRYAKAATAGQTTDLLLDVYAQYPREDVSVTTFPHRSAPNQPSVIVRIEGRTRPDEVLILGSHIDSIASFSSSAPGADDNASGTSSNYEVFRIIMENGLRFDRTIEIHGYAAEELGLVGSQDIAKKYADTGVKVVAMLQNDMNMYREGSRDVIWLITNDTDSRLTSDLAQLVSSYQSATVDLKQGRLSAGTSDHRAWTRQGFPAAFPTENPTAYNRAIHTSRDTIASSGYFTQSAEFSKLSLSFLAHFAGLQSEK